ncbi:MAG TPA: hypothetical protein VGM79_25030 [Streptosporangiaceae bacterium]
MHRPTLSSSSLHRSLRSFFSALPALVSALPGLLKALPARLRALLGGLAPRAESLLRATRSVSVESLLRRLASASRSVRSVSPESARRSVESGLHSLRSVTARSLARDAQRLARRPSRLTLGVTAGAVVAIAAIAAGVSSGSAPAVALSDAAGHGSAVAAGPVGHAPATGQGSAASTPATGLGSAGHAPSGHAAASHAPSGRTPASHAPSGHARSGHAAASHAAKHAPARHATAAHVTVRHARTGHAGRVSHAAAAPAKPSTIYDSVIPSAIPSSQKSVATYATGPFAARASQVAGKKVMWIDTRGYDYKASVLDVEPGDATPSVAASWAWHRLKAHPDAIARLYTMRSEWGALKSAVSSFPAQMQHRIHWWIADPTGTPHLVPGSDATQWYWGSHYDITTAAPGF